MSVTRPFALIGIAAMSGCAAILGADFDERAQASATPSDAEPTGIEESPPSGDEHGDASAAGKSRDARADGKSGSSGGEDASVDEDAGETADDAGGSTGQDAATCARQAGVGDLRLTEIQWQAYDTTRWVELTNVSACKINVRDVAVYTYRNTVSGDEQMNFFPSDLWVNPGERAVLSSSVNFPENIPRHYGPPHGSLNSGWLFVPNDVKVKRGTTTLIDLNGFPDNFAHTTRRAWALPEAPCTSSNPLNVTTWQLTTSAFSPNTLDVGQTGTPGKANTDVACP